jgi:hypothetical protein
MYKRSYEDLITRTRGTNWWQKKGKSYATMSLLYFSWARRHLLRSIHSGVIISSIIETVGCPLPNVTEVKLKGSRAADEFRVTRAILIEECGVVGSAQNYENKYPVITCSTSESERRNSRSFSLYMG